MTRWTRLKTAWDSATNRGFPVHHGPFFLRVGRMILLAVVGLYLASLMARLFWLLVTPVQAFDEFGIHQTPAINHHLSVSAPMHQSLKQPLDIAGLSQLSVFGRVASKNLLPTPVPVLMKGPEDEATDTRLKLTLSGVIGSSRAQDARAIIVDGRHQGLYGPEQAIERQAGVKLVKVLEDRVILDNNGRYESLWLYCEEPLLTTTKAVTATAKKSPSSSHCGRAAVGVLAQTSALNPRDAKPNLMPSLNVKQSFNVKSDRVLAAEDVPTFDKLIKFSLARKGGEVIGYKIRAGQNAALFTSMGLKNSDIVTSVNGVLLDSSARAMEVYQMLRGASSAELELMRDNTAMRLSVDVSRRES